MCKCCNNHYNVMSHIPPYCPCAPPVCPPIDQNRIRRDLIGKSYAQAIRYLRYYGIVYRVSKVDNYFFALTLDFNPNRVNLILKTCMNFNMMSNPAQVLSYIARYARCVTVIGVTFG